MSILNTGRENLADALNASNQATSLKNSMAATRSQIKMRNKMAKQNAIGTVAGAVAPYALNAGLDAIGGGATTTSGIGSAGNAAGLAAVTPAFESGVGAVAPTATGAGSSAIGAAITPTLSSTAGGAAGGTAAGSGIGMAGTAGGLSGALTAGLSAIGETAAAAGGAIAAGASAAGTAILGALAALI